jgi:hypothetical protein
MGGKPSGLCRQATSPWAVALGGCTPGVKELALKGTGEARGKPPRSQAWLRTHMVSKRSDERPTGNRTPATLYLAYLASITRSTGQRPHPRTEIASKDDRGWEPGLPAQRLAEVNLFTLCLVGIPRGAGWVIYKSPPTHVRRVRHCERGRPMRGGEQSPSEARGRRRLHSSRSAGKPRTWRREPACWDFDAN